MFRHTSRLQFESKPDQPDPVYAHKLQELIGGAYGEMTVTMQYLFQGWDCRYIVASGNLLADFRANAAAEAQGRLQTARLYNMTDDNGVRDMLRFNLARDTLHQNLWLRAIEELQDDGLEATAAPNALFDEEYAEHATSVWHLSDGPAGAEGGWASGKQPDGRHEFGYLTDPEPLGDVASVPAPDPALYATYEGAMGKPSGPALGTETGLAGKIKDKLS
jgi:Mn-containing catalase